MLSYGKGEGHRSNWTMHKAWNPQKLSPAMKIALKAKVLGAAKNNKEAAAISGLHPVYIGAMSNTPLGKGFMAAHEDKVDEKLVETSTLIQLLGREALSKMGGLMRWSQDENIILRAAQDLMDRSQETQKVHRAQIESFSISGKDAQELALAMVESARERSRFVEAAQGDFVKIKDQEVITGGAEDAAA